MRTLVIILVGLVLVAVCLGIGRLVAGNRRPAYAAFFWLFVAVWVVAAAVNMWVGVVQAGYSFLEELPIFLVIVLVPVLAGYFLRRRLDRGTNEVP